MDQPLRKISAEDINPRHNWGRALPALGTMGVDFEERVDYRRLHRYRLGRVQQALANSELGALLVFDVNNIRYITSTKIGEWESDKLSRWALLTRAAAMVDGAYHLIYEHLKPGTRENDIVALVNKFLYENGSDDVEAINAISGERCNPHPHNFTDRMLRPGDQAFFDILQAFMGYRTCYYRTFNVGRATPVQHDAYKKAREWLDKAIELIKPGVTTDKVCSVWPKAQEFGFPDEMAAFGLQFGHGLGLALHERPIISRVISMTHPTEIKEGMVFALETYCPATDGFSAARIEEEVVVTDKGCRVITLFPAEELPISAKY
jgi:Xaa-Pro dipeptidase